MATNYVQNGDVIDYTNAGADIASGAVVIVGANGDAMVTVALNDIPTGETGPLGISGVFDVPKADAAVITQGEFVTWDASAGTFDDNAAVAASGDVKDGAVAFETKGATSGETIKVKLTGVPGTLTA